MILRAKMALARARVTGEFMTDPALEFGAAGSPTTVPGLHVVNRSLHGFREGLHLCMSSSLDLGSDDFPELTCWLEPAEAHPGFLFPFRVFAPLHVHCLKLQ